MDKNIDIIPLTQKEMRELIFNIDYLLENSELIKNDKGRWLFYRDLIINKYIKIYLSSPYEESQ